MHTMDTDVHVYHAGMYVHHIILVYLQWLTTVQNDWIGA